VKGEYSVLSRINSPSDLKSLSMEELYILAREIREEIIGVVSENGGHLASNLGVVELTIALHRIFDSPKDKIIWDVGHQCYAHKILTGRKNIFHTIRRKNGLSGFPKRSESEHDIVETGHSSTSLSAGIGILVGQYLSGLDGKVVAVIGDGALSAGMALEALNFIGHIQKDLIIVLNDNKMSISPNVGALSSYLSRLTATMFYQDIRNRIDRSVQRIPLVGDDIFNLMVRLKKGVKAVVFSENIFYDLGFEYVGPINGHNIHLLNEVFGNVRELKKPVVIQKKKKKGKGYLHAEDNPTLYHGVSAFSVVDGKIEKKNHCTFTEVFSEAMVKCAKRNEDIVAITAAMAKGTGLTAFQNHFPERFFDVGITEQHAVTFASGLAIAGKRPVVAIYSTFMQRAVDQVIHDVALPGLPVVFAMDRAGLVGDDGDTHQGLYDIPLFRCIPGITLLAPAGGRELENMLEYGLSLHGPVMIRYPKEVCGRDLKCFSEPLEEGIGVFVRREGEDVLLLSAGGLLKEVLTASEILIENGIGTDIYNLRFIKPLDEEYLVEVLSEYRVVLAVEDGAVIGGIGEQISSIVQRRGVDTDFIFSGVPDKFIPHATREELLADCGLDGMGIARRIIETLSQPSKFHLVRSEAGGSS